MGSPSPSEGSGHHPGSAVSGNARLCTAGCQPWAPSLCSGQPPGTSSVMPFTVCCAEAPFVSSPSASLRLFSSHRGYQEPQHPRRLPHHSRVPGDVLSAVPNALHARSNAVLTAQP